MLFTDYTGAARATPGRAALRVSTGGARLGEPTTTSQSNLITVVKKWQSNTRQSAALLSLSYTT